MRVSGRRKRKHGGAISSCDIGSHNAWGEVMTQAQMHSGRSRGRRSRTAGVVAVLSVFAAIGALVLAYGVSLWREAAASEQWPTVTGVIRTSEVAPAGGQGQGGAALYQPHIVYEYEIDDQKYTNDRVSFSRAQTSNREQVEDELFLYPEGMGVAVYVDPDDPTRAILEPGPGVENWLLLGAGGLFTVAPLLVLVVIVIAGRRGG